MTSTITRTRPNPLVVMLTATEKAQIIDYANAKGVSMSELARDYITKGMESDKAIVQEYIRKKQAKYNA